MYNFKVVRDNNTLIIYSNTTWECSSYGNIWLDKTNGIGNDVITMSVPYGMDGAYANICFTYGDERCEYPVVSIYLSGGCYLLTEPMYNNKKQLSITYSDSDDGINIKVFSNREWYISRSEGMEAYYVNDYDLIIIPSKNSCITKATLACECENIEITLLNEDGGTDSEEIISVETKNIVTGITVETSRREEDIFDCNGGTFGATGYTLSDVYSSITTSHKFTDCCGNEYDNGTTINVIKSNVPSKNEFYRVNDKFNYVSCCNGNYEYTRAIPFYYEGFQKVVKFKQVCNDCSSDPQCQTIECVICGPSELNCSGTAKYNVSTAGCEEPIECVICGPSELNCSGTAKYNVSTTGCEEPPTPPPTPTKPKVILTLSNSTTVEISCDDNELTYDDMTSVVTASEVIKAEIKDCVTEIGGHCFDYERGFTNITGVTIPTTVTRTGRFMFYKTTSIKSIILPNSITKIAEGTFWGSGLTAITIPNSVTKIDSYAFKECSNLKTVTIGTGCTGIGVSFGDCTSLTSITCLATTPPFLSSAAFDNTNNCPIYVPAESIGEYEFEWAIYRSRLRTIS